MDFEQLAMPAENPTTVVRLTALIDPDGELMVRMDVTDQGGAQVALKLWPRRDVAKLESILTSAVDDIVSLIQRRHSPF